MQNILWTGDNFPYIAAVIEPESIHFDEGKLRVWSSIDSQDVIIPAGATLWVTDSGRVVTYTLEQG